MTPMFMYQDESMDDNYVFMYQDESMDDNYVDTDCLALKLIHGITSRQYYERRHGGHSASTDDALIGTVINSLGKVFTAILPHQGRRFTN